MPLSAQASTQATLDIFLRWCEAKGYTVGENPRFGNKIVHNVHVAGSWHYSGLAADINYGPDGSVERAHLITAMAAAESLGLAVIFARDGTVGAAASHQDHLHVDCGSWSNYGLGDVPAKPATRIDLDEDDMPFTEDQLRRFVREEAAQGLLVNSLATFKMRVGEAVWSPGLINEANGKLTSTGTLLRFIEKGQLNTNAHVTATVDPTKVARRVRAILGT